MLLIFFGRLSKLNNRFWLETDDFTGKNTEKISKSILPTVVPFANSPLGTTTPFYSRLEFFPQKNTFCKKPTKDHTTQQYPDLLVTFREGFNMNTGNKNPVVFDEKPSFSQTSMSSPLVFVCVKNIKKYHPPLKTPGVCIFCENIWNCLQRFHFWSFPFRYL